MSSEAAKVRKVALVTGAARRIGRQICSSLHQEGFDIAIHCNHSLKEAEELQQILCNERKSSSIIIQEDLSKEIEKTSFIIIKKIIDTWGRLDLLVNNASVFKMETLKGTTSQLWDEVMDVNLKAPVFLMKAAAPYLKISRGNIINLSDLVGKLASPSHFAHAVGKYALIGATKNAAIEFAPEVRVNCISPGLILPPEVEKDFYTLSFYKKWTESTPLERNGTVEDVAKTVLFLINVDYITGENITLDGGIRNSWHKNVEKQQP